MLIFGALALGGWGDAALARDPDTIVLTNSSPPSTTKVWPGQPVEIRLKTQAGTGYSWKPTNWQSMIRELNSDKASRHGGKEVQRFLFKTKSKGTYFVHFTYGQPWKGGAKDAKSRSFTIEVR
jgi:predicted secreted protein